MPLEVLNHDEFAGAQPTRAEVQAREARALRQAVAERLEQHRRRRGTGASADAPAALPGLGAAGGGRAAKPNRVADSVAARFAQSQTYRDFLHEEAEAATRQAEAAAEVARRNADAIAVAQQQLMQEMREWEQRQHFAATDHAGHGYEEAAGSESSPEAGLLLPMPSVATPARDMEVLGPSESLREAAAVDAPAAIRRLETNAGAEAVNVPPAVALPASVSVPAAMLANAFDVTTAVAAPAVPQPIKIAMPVNDPAEPPTPIPANLIEFPRQLVAARKARPRFAEGPLRDEANAEPERAQLRIFEVEASSFSTTPVAEPASSLPEWSDIRLDSTTAPHETAQPDTQMSMALPVYAAPLERRVMAAAVDGCCVGVAFVLAVAAAGMAGGELPTGLFALGTSAVTLFLFGVGYLLLSFTLSGQTVGMRYARIALCTFGDDNPTRSAMRQRLFAMGLSAVSLGLGFAWAMLDDDKLGWHDRISRMYQRAY